MRVDLERAMLAVSERERRTRYDGDAKVVSEYFVTRG